MDLYVSEANCDILTKIGQMAVHEDSSAILYISQINYFQFYPV